MINMGLDLENLLITTGIDLLKSIVNEIDIRDNCNHALHKCFFVWVKTVVSGSIQISRKSELPHPSLPALKQARTKMIY